MRDSSKAGRRVRGTAFVASALVIVVMLGSTPAGAHVGGTLDHLVGHLKDFFYTKTQSDHRYLRSTVRPGQTIRGTVGDQVRVSNVGEIGVNAQLQLAAPVGLDDAHVVIDGVDEVGDECSGTSTDPTAAPGYVCIYPYSEANMTANEGAVWGAGDGTKWGFQVSLNATSTTIAYWFANWAYRAPLSSTAATKAATGDGCAGSGQAGC